MKQYIFNVIICFIQMYLIIFLSRLTTAAVYNRRACTALTLEISSESSSYEFMKIISHHSTLYTQWIDSFVTLIIKLFFRCFRDRSLDRYY